MKEKEKLSQEFTHVVKTEHSVQDRKKSLRKLLITCIFIFLAMVIVFSLVFGISIAKKS